MALKLICESSVERRKNRLYDALIKESVQKKDKSFLLLVPEQFTLQAQRDIVLRHPDHGSMNIDILSFQRLAYRVMEEFSMLDVPVLGESGKSMVIRRALRGCAGKLPIYERHIKQPGFITQIRAVLSEFSQYGVDSRMLLNVAGQTGISPRTGEKLGELATIMEAFRDFTRDRYVTSEDLLQILKRMAGKSALLGGAIVYIDGFNGFMPIQYDIITELLRCCGNVTAASAISCRAARDAKSRRLWDIEDMPYKMVQRLCAAAKEAGCGVEFAEDAEETEKAYADSLDFLKDHLFGFSGESYKGSDDSVRLVVAADKKKEVSFLSGEVSRLVREEGMRYRDIAVICGDLEGFKSSLKREFDDAGIPYFLDVKEKLLDSPAAELVRSALDLADRDFSYESLFRYLKNPLAADAGDDIFCLENFVRMTGIRGEAAFKKDFTKRRGGRRQYDTDRLNACKAKLLAPVFALSDAIKSEKKISGKTKALRDFLDIMFTEEKLSEVGKKLQDAGWDRESREFAQIPDKIRGILDEMDALLGEEETDITGFKQMLDAGFAEISVGVIPAMADRLVVGDILRSRFDSIKVLFLIGANEGAVPATPPFGGILNETERELFEKNGIVLAPGFRENIFEQRYVLHSMLTRPEKRLCISCAAVGADGRAKAPSYIYSDIQKLLPGLATERYENDTGLYSPVHVRQAVASGLSGLAAGEDVSCKEAEKTLRLYAAAKALGVFADLDALSRAAFYKYTGTNIGKEAARRLYGSTLRASVTRLELFNGCAYAHFLRYGLGLTEREDRGVKPPDAGNIFHEALRQVLARVEEAGGWAAIPDERRDELAEECFQNVASEYEDALLLESERNKALADRMKRVFLRSVWAICRQQQRGGFHTEYLEKEFGKENIPLLKTEVAGGRLVLLGKIDRVDVCREEGKTGVVVVDYKSGEAETRFDLGKVYLGEKLQLAVYMQAAMELLKAEGKALGTVVPAGMFYYNISDPMLEADGDDSITDEKLLRQLRMNGLANSDEDILTMFDADTAGISDIITVSFNKDGSLGKTSCVADTAHFEGLLSHAFGCAAEDAEKIFAGVSDKRPLKTGGRQRCDTCLYRSVCGFDTRLPGYRPRESTAPKKEDIWEKICSPADGQDSSGRS